MTVRAQLEKALTKVEAAHDKNHAAYTTLRKDVEKTTVKMRAAKAKAGVTANEVAALKDTLAKMPADAA